MALSLVVAVGAGGCGGNSGDEPAAQAGQAGMGGSLAGAGGVPGGNGGGEAAGQGGAGAAGQGGGGGATGGVGGAAGEGGSGGAAGSGGEAPDVPPPAPSDAWCDRVVAGPAGTKSPAVDLSAAHASVRFFGPDPSRTKADGALSDALGADDPWALPALQAYVSAVGDGCALGAVDSGLPDASVTLSEQVAIIKPGKGAISLPAGATVVAVDLRGLPAVEGLGAAVEQAVGLALAAPVARSKARVRQHYGLTDEVYAPLAGIQNIYTNTVENVARPAIAGSAPADLPLVLLTGPQLAPEAAEIAATLRLGKRAWIAGEDLLTAVAEAHWFGVGSAGIAHRDRMIGGTTPWPDAIAADVRTPYPERHAAELAAMGAPPAVSSGPHARPPIAPLAQTIPAEEGDATIGGARAALTVAHGATRLFFPYFSVVGDTIDETLSTELTALDTAPSPLSLARPASRFSAGLHDSHSWIFQYPLPNAPPSKLRIIPLLLDDSDQGEAVVRRSALADIPRGEVLLAIGGKALSDITAALSPLLSASTPGALRRDLLQYSLYVQNGEGVSIDLRAADGTTHSVMVATESLVKGSAGLAVSTRPNGSLADLGAADLFYVNLDGPIFKAPATSKSVMTQAQNAKGLVIDARGYPGTQETWDFIKRVLKTKSVIQLDVDQISPIERVTQHDEQAWEPLTAPRFEGPIVVLIGPSTQSQAEHILIPLVNEKRATFLGRQTAGADGNITGVMLPGHLGMTFTGTRVRFADGSVFHGHGILPDMELKPTQAQLSASEDPELLAAVAMLK